VSKQQWGHGYYCGFQKGIQARVSFYEYCVFVHGGENSILGDFVCDMMRDKQFPKNIEGRMQVAHNPPSLIPYRENQYCKCIMDHLTFMRACPEAKQAFAKLWAEWRNEVDRT